MQSTCADSVIERLRKRAISLGVGGLGGVGGRGCLSGIFRHLDGDDGLFRILDVEHDAFRQHIDRRHAVGGGGGGEDEIGRASCRERVSSPV